MGNNIKNIIEINGKRYDSVTGSYLGNSTAKPATPIHTVRSRNIDGFVRVSRDTKPIPLSPPAPIMQKAAPAIAAGTVRKPHAPGNHNNAHRPQKATTLMRSAVKKPVIKSPAVIKAQTRTDILARVPQQALVPKLSVGSVDPSRQHRAERMIKHSAISRYARDSPAVTSYAPLTSHRPVSRPAPVPTHQQAATHHSAQTVQPYFTDLRPGAANQQSKSVDMKPAPHAAHSRHTSPSRRPDRSASSDLFEQALAHAVSHEQTFDQPTTKRRKKGRFLRVVSGSLVALMLVGVLAYFKAPDVSLKVASYKAGFDAKLPATKPVGYTFGHLSYEPGNVIVNFTSEDSKQFNITQKVSDWDSQALLNNFVSTVGSAHQTYQKAGRTVYLYGNNTATWVDSGVWYTVDGNSSLTSSQLLDVAASM